MKKMNDLIHGWQASIQDVYGQCECGNQLRPGDRVYYKPDATSDEDSCEECYDDMKRGRS